MSHHDIQLVIFDCDGVLVDSEIISATILADELSRLGITLTVEDTTWRFLGRSFEAIAAAINRDFSVQLPAEFEERYRTLLLSTFETELRPTPGVEGVVADLSVERCVATSSAVPRASRALELTRLDRFFSGRLFTASEVRHGKPAPDLFLRASERMGVAPSQCLVIEDSAPGIEAAARAGMRSLAYTGGSHMRSEGRPPAVPDGSLGRIDSWESFRTQFSNLLG